MKKEFFFFLLFVSTAFTNRLLAQQSDFLVFKKNSKTIVTYFSGTPIQFVTRTGAFRDAKIERIANDSVFIREYLVRRVMTSMGFYVIDTAGSFHYAYHYNEIHIIGTPPQKFNWNASGSSLLGGGILLTAASGISFLVDRKRFSPELMLAGVAAGLIGYGIIRLTGRPKIIGKKGYTLQYISVSK